MILGVPPTKIEIKIHSVYCLKPNYKMSHDRSVVIISPRTSILMSRIPCSHSIAPNTQTFVHTNSAIVRFVTNKEADHLESVKAFIIYQKIRMRMNRRRPLQDITLSKESFNFPPLKRSPSFIGTPNPNSEFEILQKSLAESLSIYE